MNCVRSREQPAANWPASESTGTLVPKRTETGDSAATESPSGWNRMISLEIMRDLSIGVQVSSAPDGWNFEHETATAAGPPSSFVDGAIGATGIAVRAAGSRWSSVVVSLADAIEPRRKAARTIAIVSGTGGLGVAPSAWRIAVP